MKEKPNAVPSKRNTGTNYADSRYQLPQIDTEVREFTFVGKSRVLEKEEVLERMLDSKLASAVVIKSSNLACLCVHMKSCLHEASWV